MTAPTKNALAVVDPYDANAPENRISNQTRPDTRALALKTKVGQMLLSDDSPFYALARAANVPAEAMVLELAAAVGKNPDILTCTPASIMGFMLDAAKLRLGIGRGIFPVALKGKLEGWVGYKGAKELAMRSGAIRDCWATIVYEGDDFLFVKAPIPRVERHIDGPNTGNMEKAIGVYATLLYPGGTTRAKYFTRTKIESYKAKNRSASGGSSPWATNPEEMWHAKAILHTVNDLPHSSPEIAHLGAMLERESARDDAPALGSGSEIPSGEFTDFDPATGEDFTDA